MCNVLVLSLIKVDIYRDFLFTTNNKLNNTLECSRLYTTIFLLVNVNYLFVTYLSFTIQCRDKIGMW